MMGVDNHVQAGVMGIARHFVDPVQPGLVDLVVRRGTDHLQPGDRDADAGEAGPFQVGESHLGGLASRLPDFFVRITFLLAGPGAVVIAVEMIAHVPAQTQLRGHLPGVIVTAGRGRRRLRRLFRLLGDGHFHGRDAGGHEGHLGGPDCRGLVGRHHQLHGHLVILVGAVLVGNPIRPAGQDRAGRGGDVDGNCLSGLGNLEGSLAHRQGFRRFRGRVHRIVLFSTGKGRHERGQQGQESFHHFREGICSRVRTRLEDISVFQ